MRKVNKIIIFATAIFMLVVMIFTISGCTRKIASNIAENAVENAAKEEGQDIDVDLEEGQVNITDNEGNELSIGSGEIPSDWPSVVPINDNIKISSSGKETEDGKPYWYIDGTYNGSSQELSDYYKSKLSGWNKESETTVESNGLKSFIYEASNGSYYVSFVISDTKDKGTTIVLKVDEM